MRLHARFIYTDNMELSLEPRAAHQEFERPHHVPMLVLVKGPDPNLFNRNSNETVDIDVGETMQYPTELTSPTATPQEVAQTLERMSQTTFEPYLLCPDILTPGLNTPISLQNNGQIEFSGRFGPLNAYRITQH